MILESLYFVKNSDVRSKNKQIGCTTAGNTPSDGYHVELRGLNFLDHHHAE
jgi:hypothetical protein